MMTPLSRHQRGASFVGLLFGVAILAVLVTAGLRLVPLYLDDRIVENTLEDVLARPEADTMSLGEIRNETRRALTRNNIRDFDTDAIQQVREGGIEYVVVDYERRVPLFYNIDAVVSFEHRINK